MTSVVTDIPLEERARATLGISNRAIYAMVATLLRRLHGSGGRLCDIGCGAALFREFASPLCDSYCGVDAVRYDSYPNDAEFIQTDLDSASWPVRDEVGDVVVAIETIEHLENPRAFFRELTRITRPGGTIVVTTPNQLSLLSKLTLLVKGQFNAFQQSSYPAHRTALLKVDLERIARECGLVDLHISFTNSGRIPGTSCHWPPPFGGQMFSDNIALAARKPARISSRGGTC
jgi:SAM-dependent methyltransferase